MGDCLRSLGKIALKARVLCVVGVSALRNHVIYVLLWLDPSKNHGLAAFLKLTCSQTMVLEARGLEKHVFYEGSEAPEP